MPAAAGSLLIVLAAPVFAIAGWSIASWALAAVLWFAGELFAFAMQRLPTGYDHLASSGFVGFAMTIRMIVTAGVLIAVAASNEDLVVPAALLFLAAYSLELGLMLSLYFGTRQ